MNRSRPARLLAREPCSAESNHTSQLGVTHHTERLLGGTQSVLERAVRAALDREVDVRNRPLRRHPGRGLAKQLPPLAFLDLCGLRAELFDPLLRCLSHLFL